MKFKHLTFYCFDITFCCKKAGFQSRRSSEGTVLGICQYINLKNKKDALGTKLAFYKLVVDVHFVTNVLGESISSISMWNIVNQ